MACYIPRWYTRPKTVTRPCTNRARRALTSFMRRTPLTTTPRRQPRHAAMQPVVMVVAWSVCMFVCLSVGHTDTTLSCAKTAEPTEIPFRVCSQVGPKSPRPTHRHTGHFWGGWIDFARKIWGSARRMNSRTNMIKQDETRKLDYIDCGKSLKNLYLHLDFQSECLTPKCSDFGHFILL